MKKTLFILSILLIALSSCKKNSKKCHNAETKVTEASIELNEASANAISNPTDENLVKLDRATEKYNTALDWQDQVCN